MMWGPVEFKDYVHFQKEKEKIIIQECIFFSFKNNSNKKIYIDLGCLSQFSFHLTLRCLLES